MKNKILLSSLISISMLCAFGYEKVYINTINRTPNVYRNFYSPNHPYSSYNTNFKRMYHNPYQYSRYNADDTKRLRRMHNFLRLQRLKNSYLSFDINKLRNGSLTGYSVPIPKDTYEQMGIAPYDAVNRGKQPSNMYRQDLYSMPQANESYSRNGIKNADLGGVQGKTGVQVIYD